MALRLLPAVVLLVACSAHAQDADPNLQNLLTSLTTGSATTLVTPLRNGMAQVTTFQPGTRLSAAQANLMISQARDSLRALGETQPSAEEIARMLAGGPIELQSGRIQTTGMLRSAGWPGGDHPRGGARGPPFPFWAPNCSRGGRRPFPSRERRARG